MFIQDIHAQLLSTVMPLNKQVILYCLLVVSGITAVHQFIQSCCLHCGWELFQKLQLCRGSSFMSVSIGAAKSVSMEIVMIVLSLTVVKTNEERDQLEKACKWEACSRGKMLEEPRGSLR